ncbi:MAG TPA: hypothetical protein VII43_05780, partial [Opitutaceae bacterium]
GNAGTGEDMMIALDPQSPADGLEKSNHVDESMAIILGGIEHQGFGFPRVRHFMDALPLFYSANTH